MESSKIGIKLAPYNPTNYDAVTMAIEMIQFVDNDIVYDLGCGDARFLVSACSINSSIRGIGVEYDYDVYQKAVDNVASSAMMHQIKLLHENVLNIDFGDATVLFIYLVPEGIQKLKDSLVAAIERGVRIVTYVFSIPGITPNTVNVYKGITKLYLYKKDDKGCNGDNIIDNII